MTRERTTPSPLIERNAIDDGIRRARRFRSQYLTALLTGLVKKIAGWYRRGNQTRHLRELPDYLLRDMGIDRGQIEAVMAGNLRRDPLAPVPPASPLLGALRREAETAAVNDGTETESENRLAA